MSNVNVAEQRSARVIDIDLLAMALEARDNLDDGCATNYSPREKAIATIAALEVKAALARTGGEHWAVIDAMATFISRVAATVELNLSSLTSVISEVRDGHSDLTDTSVLFEFYARIERVEIGGGPLFRCMSRVAFAVCELAGGHPIDHVHVLMAETDYVAVILAQGVGESTAFEFIEALRAVGRTDA